MNQRLLIAFTSKGEIVYFFGNDQVNLIYRTLLKGRYLVSASPPKLDDKFYWLTTKNQQAEKL